VKDKLQSKGAPGAVIVRDRARAMIAAVRGPNLYAVAAGRHLGSSGRRGSLQCLAWASTDGSWLGGARLVCWVAGVMLAVTQLSACGSVDGGGTCNAAVKEIVAATGAINSLTSGLNHPHDVAVDAAGNVYVADSGNNAVKEIVAATGAIRMLGSGFNSPSGVAVDAAGNVYVADSGNNAVKEIVAATGAINTLGSGFNSPNAVAVDASGRVYVIDSGKLWRFTP
jgi:streptogramin lyase